jgi:predicted nucleic acid-binding protein
VVSLRNIIVDSNIWIFSVISEYPEHPLAVTKLENFSRRGIITNIIIISETYHKLSALLGCEKARFRVNKILDSEFVQFSPLSEETMRKAISLSCEKRLRINDALIAQHCLDMKASVLTDNIRDFKKIRSLRIIGLR